MNTNEQLQWLDLAEDDTPVVLVHSHLSDVRAARRELQARGVPYRELVLDMGVAQDRERFHDLRAHTGWATLPQAFYRGRFVGGPEELSAALRPIHGWGDRRGAGFALLGLLPLILAGLWLAFADPRWHGWVLQALVHYLALGLAFAGALQWRDAVQGAGLSFWRQAALAAIPALYAWVVLMVPILAEAAVLLLAAGFIAVYVARRSLLFHHGKPRR